jgi:hypothetical protein
MAARLESTLLMLKNKASMAKVYRPAEINGLFGQVKTSAGGSTLTSKKPVNYSVSRP